MMTHGENHRGWLFGPVPDLLWGAGLGYVGVFGLLLVASTAMMSVFPPWLMIFLVLLLSIPHYGATILRVYEREEDRRAYAFVSKYSTLALGVLLIWGVRDIWVGSILFTLYLTWSLWHYTGQNYGITLMFLGRRGVEISPRTKHLLRVSFVAAFVVRFFYIHGSDAATAFGDRVQFLSLNVPALAADMVIFAALLVYGASTIFVAAALLPKGVGRVGPAFVLMATHSLWFVVPSAINNWLPYVGLPILTRSHEAYAILWVALGHAMQYLWISTYFARASRRTASTVSFYFKALMAGCIVWSVPLVLFAPGLLGRLPYDVGLLAVTSAIVNLHHFVLDGAIWKLRDSRIRRILVKRNPEASAPAAEPRRSSPLRWPVVATGLASLAVLLFGAVEEEFGLARGLSQKDLEKSEVAIERLAVVGRDSHYARMKVGALAAQAGELERSVHHLEAGVRLYPTVSGWTRLGEALATMGDKQAAIEAFENALAIDPVDETSKLHLALTWAEIGETERARKLLRASGSGEETVSSWRLRQRLISVLEP